MAAKSKAIVLKQFFGLKPGQTLAEFAAELKALSEEELLELAILAADELGIPEEERAFTTKTTAAA
jgi:hypothetical protein